MKKIILIAILMFVQGSLTILAERNEGINSEWLISQNTNKKQVKESINFYSAATVMAWLSGKTFISEGTKIKFSYDAVYLNGAVVTGAPIVKRFTKTTATIEAHSPYMGGAGMTFYLDASKGTVTQAGDVFYLTK